MPPWLLELQRCKIDGTGMTGRLELRSVQLYGSVLGSRIRQPQRLFSTMPNKSSLSYPAAHAASLQAAQSVYYPSHLPIQFGGYHSSPLRSPIPAPPNAPIAIPMMHFDHRDPYPREMYVTSDGKVGRNESLSSLPKASHHYKLRSNPNLNSSKAVDTLFYRERLSEFPMGSAFPPHRMNFNQVS